MAGAGVSGAGVSGARVTGSKGIVFTLTTGEESTESVRLADTVKFWSIASGEQFMDVALVCDVKDKAILRRVEGAVESDTQLDDTQIGTNVSAVLRGDLNDALANFFR